MAEAVRSAFNDRAISVYPDAGHVQVDERISTSLRRQLLEAEIVETERGQRITSRRGPAGHGDQLSALALALYGATLRGIPSTPLVSQPTSDVERARQWIKDHPGRWPFRHRDGRPLWRSGEFPPQRRVPRGF